MRRSDLWYRLHAAWRGYHLCASPCLAEVNRAPFDMPEAEQELTAGYHTEYSGMKFALFFMAEYIKMIAVSMIGATLFLGGYLRPFQGWFESLPVIGPIIPCIGPFVLLAKVVVLLFVLHLGARHPAAHPLRPPDGIWLENALPAGTAQCAGDRGSCDRTGRRLET